MALAILSSADARNTGGVMKRRLTIYLISSLMLAQLAHLVQAQDKTRVERDLLGEKSIPADAYSSKAIER